jgi:hypothetical protein
VKGDKMEEIKEEGDENEAIVSEKQILKISKIRTNFWKEEILKFNVHKLLAFFEFLQNYGFKMNFEESNREMI